MHKHLTEAGVGSGDDGNMVLGRVQSLAKESTAWLAPCRVLHVREAPSVAPHHQSWAQHVKVNWLHQAQG